MNNENILILGASGFIGHNLVKKLSSVYSGLIVTINKSSKSHQNLNILNYNIRINESEKIYRILIKYQIRVVVHLVSNLVPVSSKRDFHKEKKDVINPSFKIINISGFNSKFVKISL